MNSLPSAIALDLNCTDNGHACSMARWAHLGAVKRTPFEPIWHHTIHTDYNFLLVQEPLAQLEKGVQTLQLASKMLKQFTHGNAPTYNPSWCKFPPTNTRRWFSALDH